MKRDWDLLTEDEQDNFLEKVREEYGETIGPKEAIRLAEQLFYDDADETE